MLVILSLGGHTIS